MLLSCSAGKDSWESLAWHRDQTSQSSRKSVLNIHWKDWCRRGSSITLAAWCEELTHLKDPDAGKDWGREEKGMTEDEMVGWYYWFDEYEFEYTPGVGDGQGGLACCSPWGCKESDMTEQVNWTELKKMLSDKQAKMEFPGLGWSRGFLWKMSDRETRIQKKRREPYT